MPPVSALTAPDFCSIILSRFNFKSPTEKQDQVTYLGTPLNDATKT